MLYPVFFYVSNASSSRRRALLSSLCQAQRTHPLTVSLMTLPDLPEKNTATPAATRKSKSCSYTHVLKSEGEDKAAHCGMRAQAAVARMQSVWVLQRDQGRHVGASDVQVSHGHFHTIFKIARWGRFVWCFIIYHWKAYRNPYLLTFREVVYLS